MSSNPFSTPAVPGNGGTFSGQMGAPPVPGGGQQAPGNYLGLPTNAAQDYFEKNPNDAFQLYVNKLGGMNSPLGRYASRHFNETYSQYLQQGANNPSLRWTDYLNQYAQGGQLTQGYAQASPFARDPYNQPSWAPGRFLG